MRPFLGEYANGYVLHIDISARYNACCLTHSSTDATVVLASAMAAAACKKNECIYKTLVGFVNFYSHNIGINIGVSISRQLSSLQT